MGSFRAANITHIQYRCTDTVCQVGRTIAAEVLLLGAMSSEEGCYEDGDDDNRKVVRYQVKKLAWESRRLRNTKKKSWTKLTKKSLTKRAQERILERTVAPELSQGQPPDGIPGWAVQE